MTKEELITFVENTFESYGLKTVSKTDVGKGAYVLNKEQRNIMTSLGIMPIHSNHIELKELFTNNSFTVSYYPSERVGAGREPEIRMGLTDLISYLSVGDEILFTSDGSDVFIYNLSKLGNQNIENDDSEERIYSQINIDLLQQRVQNINTTPVQVQREINVYSRNNALRAFVKLRANYSCEMPGCDYVPFEKENGEKYIEVHHLNPLAEGGEDSISNTVALCPTCHRKIHYSQNKGQLKEILEEYIRSLN